MLAGNRSAEKFHFKGLQQIIALKLSSEVIKISSFKVTHILISEHVLGWTVIKKKSIFVMFLA